MGINSKGQKASDVDRGRQEYVTKQGLYHCVLVDGGYKPESDEDPAQNWLKFSVVHDVKGLSPIDSVTYVRNNLGKKVYNDETKKVTHIDPITEGQEKQFLKMVTRLGLAKVDDDGDVCTLDGEYEFDETTIVDDAMQGHYIVECKEEEYQKNGKTEVACRCNFNEFWPIDHEDVKQTPKNTSLLADIGIDLESKVEDAAEEAEEIEL